MRAAFSKTFYLYGSTGYSGYFIDYQTVISGKQYSNSSWIFCIDSTLDISPDNIAIIIPVIVDKTIRTPINFPLPTVVDAPPHDS